MYEFPHSQEFDSNILIEDIDPVEIILRNKKPQPLSAFIKEINEGVAVSSESNATDMKSNFLYFLVTLLLIILLAVLTGAKADSIWAILAIIGGTASGFALIYKARVTLGNSVSKISIYTAGFIMLYEVIEFIDAILVHTRQ